jgi:hypothetical protein
MDVNLLKQEKTLKAYIQAKHLQAGWVNNYLLKVYSGCNAITLRRKYYPGVKKICEHM